MCQLGHLGGSWEWWAHVPPVRGAGSDSTPADCCHVAWILWFLREDRKQDFSVGSFNWKLSNNSIKNKAKHNRTSITLCSPEHGVAWSALAQGWLRACGLCSGSGPLCVVTGLRWALPGSFELGLLLAVAFLQNCQFTSER